MTTNVLRVIKFSLCCSQLSEPNILTPPFPSSNVTTQVSKNVAPHLLKLLYYLAFQNIELLLLKSRKRVSLKSLLHKPPITPPPNPN